MFENTTYSRDELIKLDDRITDAMELCDDLFDKAESNEEYQLSIELIKASMALDKVNAEISMILYGK